MHHLNPRVPFDATTRKEFLNLPFPIYEYQQRINNARRLMDDQGLAALIVFGDQNDIGSLTDLANFDPLNGRGAVVITPESVSLITDSAFHGEPMHSLIWKTWIERVKICGPSLEDFINELKSAVSIVRGKIGVTGSYSLPVNVLGFEAVDVERSFLKLKSRKSADELKVMREASRITSCGMRAAIDATRMGVRETEVAAAACKAMFDQGAPRLAFPPIVVAGPRAGIKHDFPSKRKIENGDMVYIDLGAISDGYYSDMSRTVLIGSGDQQKRDALETILEIYVELKKKIRPGVSAGEVARAGIKLAESKGWSNDFWAAGHGLGAGFMEIPMITPTSEDIFEPGMVFAYEPMIVRLGLGTAVIEDTVAVTDSGCIALTECEQKLW